MDFQGSAVRFLVGGESRYRIHYLLVVASLTLGVFIVSSEVVSTYIWLAGGIAILIGVVAGFSNYGLVIGYLGTAAFVAVVGQAAFLVATGEGVWIARVLLVLCFATAIVAIPSYLLGSGVRIIRNREA